MLRHLVSREDLTDISTDPVNIGGNELAENLKMDPSAIRNLGELLELAEQKGFEIWKVVLEINEKIRNLEVLGDYLLCFNGGGCMPPQINVERIKRSSSIELFRSFLINLEMRDREATSYGRSFPGGMILFLRKEVARIEATGGDQVF